MSKPGGRDEAGREEREEEVKGGKRAEKVAYIRTGQMDADSSHIHPQRPRGYIPYFKSIPKTTIALKQPVRNELLRFNRYMVPVGGVNSIPSPSPLTGPPRT